LADERTRIPKITSQTNADAIRGLPLTPVDGFVLSRIDGTLTEIDLAHATGLPMSDVAASLDKLALLGLVTTPGSAEPARPDDGDDGIDLESAHRHRIDALHSKLDTATHYEILGVERTADKKAIKRAYFELASLYHPDRFFRKNLGSYKQKMEALFGRITIALDVLASKTDRAEYDEYLGDVAQTREIEARIDAGSTALEAAAQELASPAVSTPPPFTPPPFTPPPFTPPPARLVVDPKARRDVLARRLLGGRPSAPVPAPPLPAPPVRPPSMAPPSDALRRHYEARLLGGRAVHARQHLDAARASLSMNDSIAAVNSLKLALEFTPDDPELARELEAATTIANPIMSETYRRQAAYEEKNGQWPEASRSWTRAANILTEDATVQERAAHAVVEAKGNLHDAARFALRAVELEPTSSGFRATLGAVYLAAGLHKNAKRELEAAQQLSPQDATIAALLKRAGDG
jgi:curved DNA-binding protein CbpA